MIFVDTSAWFDSVVQSDRNHNEALNWIHQNQSPLLTTDYVIDETLTLLRMRGEPQKAIALGEAFFSGKLTQIYYLKESDIDTTWQVFREYADKGWSFTDCSSKVVMNQLNLCEAFAFDHHFRQFGMIQVFPLR